MYKIKSNLAMSEDLTICPVCKKGRMRPFGVVDNRNYPKEETGGSYREYQCDNDDCKHRDIHEGITDTVQSETNADE